MSARLVRCWKTAALSHRRGPEGFRVLVATPFGRDADNVSRLLSDHGFKTRAVPDAQAVAAELDEQTGVVLITEEALRGKLDTLRAALAAQPDWSDTPFILLVSRNAYRPRAGEIARLALADLTTNLIVLERPLGSLSLVSAVDTALRARRRQFDLRDRLAELDHSRAALAASEAEVRLIADSLPVLIGFIDKSLVYRFANKAYADWFYRDPADVVGLHVREVVGDEGMEARMPAMRRALAGEPAHLTLPWPHADGRRRDADIRYLPRRGADGEIDGFHVFVADVTEHVQGEELLRQTAQALEYRVRERTAALEVEMERRTTVEAALRQSQKMEAVGQLTGGIAHDFNNMLTGVIGALDMVKRKRASGRDADTDRYLDTALTSAHRAAGLTHRLLAFSRRQSLDPHALDINALVSSLQDLIRRTVTEQISVDVDLGAAEAAIADANQLESAILNLAINARDAMPEGGRLTISTSVAELDPDMAAEDARPGRYVVVAVTDTGVGMSAEVLDKVFDPFFTTKPIGQGTGLGLSMVYGFARQSGGSVRIQSRVGEGTSVKIYLPAADGAVEPKAEDQPADFARGEGQTVLLVEDESAVRLLVREVLEDLGYRAVEASDPQSAIAILNSQSAIDLLISDVGLPGMNGRQLAEVARDRRPDLPILFITGYAENAAIRAGFLGSNMAMIGKPFALDTLAAKIGEMMPEASGR
ncbi:hybrid sensor histidine kinase/response regulator [Caulobacter flavus]|uniref:histidine kinase n=1 Tax=Caulobacter flavus TaxID=1679497 RepID=A0A2N5CKJ8_9CAUL|nr:PAS domain-containing sensor histidine kinase [Caulobacter flavus]AYV47632.1 hybrid sensor histidine kinase/response regulator [Caulobacter flavus]PLR05938.1 hybrid sensor histidine kinase/response regulator [Caulobacter flavus]